MMHLKNLDSSLPKRYIFASPLAKKMYTFYPLNTTISNLVG